MAAPAINRLAGESSCSGQHNQPCIDAHAQGASPATAGNERHAPRCSPRGFACISATCACQERPEIAPLPHFRLLLLPCHPLDRRQQRVTAFDCDLAAMLAGWAAAVAGGRCGERLRAARHPGPPVAALCACCDAMTAAAAEQDCWSGRSTPAARACRWYWPAWPGLTPRTR